MAKYFHELTPEERQQMYDEKMTVKELLDNYLQPKWCTHTEALGGILGCWSLLQVNPVVSEDFCKKCECFKSV